MRRVSLPAHRPDHAASLVAYTHVALDLLANQLDVQEWSTTAISTKGAMDQLIDNAFTVRVGDREFTFIRLADGTWNPMLGCMNRLIATTDPAG